MASMYDIVIIGGGVIGCSVARFLAKYSGRVCLVEKEAEICSGTSKANSAIVHAGYDAKQGSLKARFNLEGSKMMPKLCKELSIPYKNNGSLVLCLDIEDMPRLETLLANGIANGVEGLRIIDRDELCRIEPNVSDQAVAALYAPTGSIICPFELTLALAENAAENGVEFKLDTEVSGLTQQPDGTWQIDTSRGQIQAKCVVNAAGVYADKLHNMVSSHKIHITPRKGEYCLLDNSVGNLVNHTVFQLPHDYGKGVLVTPTVHGNILLGPTAFDVEDKSSVNTTKAGLGEVYEKAAKSIKGIPRNKTITSFAGLRAHQDGDEFIIGEISDAPGVFECAGIESPGLSSAPAIGSFIAEVLRDRLGLTEKAAYKATRQGIRATRDMTAEEWQQAILENPSYGRIVCRCEKVTEGEIIDAIRRPLGARTVDGVKRRTRAGMGRCQAGFCSARVIEILARELGVDKSEITKSGGESRYIIDINE